METADPYLNGKTMITELNAVDIRDEEAGSLVDSEDEERESTQIFNVKEAVPPTDYDAPYSAMPSNVTLKQVKKKVKNSYIKIAK